MSTSGTPHDLLSQLRHDEGVRYSAYQDSRGYWTIGVGTLIDARAGGELSDSEVDMLLSNRVERSRQLLSQAFPWTDALDDIRREALVNMTFNMGVGGLGEFRQMLDRLQQADWEGAAAAMLDSQWATQVGPRAARLALQIRTGEWQ